MSNPVTGPGGLEPDVDRTTTQQETNVSHRVGRRLVALAITALIMPACGLVAQRCIGTTAYVVRDEAGAIMSAAHMKRLTIRSLNGFALQLRTDSGGTEAPYYALESYKGHLNAMQFERVVAADNPLIWSLNPLADCGDVRDLTLTYAGKTMRLLFDIKEHNTYFEIAAPPFQDGTFRLRSLRCRDRARPPMIDNRTRGKCLVEADSWQRVEQEPVGQLVARALAGGPVDSTAASCRSAAGRSLEAITTQQDWDTAWKRYPGVARGNALPSVDFATQFVLVVYRPLWPRSIQLDKEGDLTFVRPLGLADGIPCSILFLTVERSGVRSIAGRPLPDGAR